MRIIVALILLCISNLIFANEKETLLWYLTDWPPAFILEGPNKGNGYAEHIIDILEREMPNVEHERVVLPYPRILKYIEEGKEGCYPTNVYNKATPYGLSSAPHVLVAGHNIYIHKDNKAKFDTEISRDGSLSLNAVLKNPALKLGVRGDLEFGPTLSPILREHKGKPNLVLQSGLSLADRLVQMLHRKRIDYFIEYNFVMRFVTDKLGAPMEDFIEIPITENRTEYIRGAVECPDDVWGQAIIAQVNGIFHRLRNNEEFRALNKKWFVSPANEKEYWKQYQRLVLDVDQ